MPYCAQCGLETVTELCTYHHDYADDWSAANRILCDLLHRKKEPKRLSAEERRDDFWSMA